MLHISAAPSLDRPPATVQETAFADASLRDVVTNLPSRMLFHDRIEHALHRRARYVHPVAVMVIDLAGAMTAVGDGMGPGTAEDLLVQVAKRLQRRVRSADTLACLSADQMGALLDDLDSAADAVLVAERLVESLREPFILEADIPLSMQAHVGIAVNAGGPESAIELLRRAGAALDTARRRGRSVEIEMHPGRPSLAVSEHRAVL